MRLSEYASRALTYSGCEKLSSLAICRICASSSPLIASSVEGVIFTIEANGSRLRAIETAIQRLRDAHANVYGAIVTKVDNRNSSYGYGYGDKYGYGYAYGQS